MPSARPEGTRPCRYCKAPILMVESVNGGQIPLSLVRTFYVVAGGKAHAVGATPAELDGEPLLRAVSHWETCSRVDAAKAAQRKKKAGAEEGRAG